MTLPLIAGLFLAAGLFVFVLRPLLLARRERAALLTGSSDETLENLLFEREATLAAIKDLQFDHAMGKLSDADFQELDTRYRHRAVEILQKLDALGVAADDREESLEVALDHWIEEAVAAARSAAQAQPAQTLAVPARFCTQCGHPAGAADRFCANCGTPLRIETPAVP
ncbi:MAG TPA: hypothetical protein DEP84_16965 [Chloroflexi bacterium]|nr:hypothetical protein [Chloroflexota bacterium]